MPSVKTLRISEIPVDVTAEEVGTRVKQCIASHRPSLARRILSSSVSSQFTISLSRYQHGQIATLLFDAAEVKDHVQENLSRTIDWPIDDDFYDVTVLHAPEQFDLDVCLVHGLGGHAIDTWATDKVLWPRDLLVHQHPFDKSRISTFGYNAGLRDSGSAVGVRQWAISLLNQLCNLKRADADHSRPVIIVCHSLGGLVGREALVRLGTFAKEYPQLSPNLVGILFLGTPHSGAAIADWNNTVLAIAQLAFGVRSSDIVDRLRAFNDHSVASKEAFAALDPSPPVACLSEGRKTKVLGTERMIVSQDSAGLNGIAAVALTNCDHRQIAKYERRTGEYSDVVSKLDALRNILQERANEDADISVPPRHAVPNNQGPVRQDIHSPEDSRTIRAAENVYVYDQGSFTVIGTVHATNFTI